MKRKLPLIIGAFLAFTLAACEGPVGPQGEPGDPGEPGAPGQNALNTCSDCHHADATIVAVEFQFENSPHAPGEFELRGPDYGGGACAACHTHQGYIEHVSDTEADWTHGYTTMNCRTCHQVHSDVDGDGDMDVGDYALTTVDPVDIRVTGETVDFIGRRDDVQYVGGNLCAECHQARETVTPSADAPMTQMFNVTSFRIGPHYGPQANVASTEIEPSTIFDGPRTIPSGEMSHSEWYGCTGCHMSNPSPSTGGHTFQVTPAACTDCHTGATGNDYDLNGVYTNVQNMMAELDTCLQAAGVMSEDGYAVEGEHPEPYVAAFLNYKTFYYDGSSGMHHPQFTVALLENTLDFMRTNAPECDN